MTLAPPARLAAAVGLALLLGGPDLEAQPSGMRLRYAFQADCFRPSLGSPCDKRKTEDRLDLGPQIAVWVESADGRKFVDTLMVTNAVAFRGIGNRPGAWDLPSSPKFPYGKRPMALPVWAHARGRLYDTVLMQDDDAKRGSNPEALGGEYWLGFHEYISTPDPYFCRPMTLAEIDVDAMSCPTSIFNSAKGRFVPSAPKSRYPPRNDLRSFTERDCDSSCSGYQRDQARCERDTSCVWNGEICGCRSTSALSFASVNDLDAVAAATPPYGEPYVGTWSIPSDLPEGEYVLLVEISKEFDQNATHMYPAFTDRNLADSGLKNNFGQPSVVFRVPFTFSRSSVFRGSASEIIGYGDWNGETGTLHPPDSTIDDTPGSGRGRLLAILPPAGWQGPPATARVHVATEQGPALPSHPPEAGPDGGSPSDGAAPSVDGEAQAPICRPPPASVSGLDVPLTGRRAEAVDVSFLEPEGDAFNATESYQVRYWEGTDFTSEAFESGIPARPLSPQRPGQEILFKLEDLKSDRSYTVGVKPVGGCLEPTVAYRDFQTLARQFTRLSGCFLATAAYGSAQAPALAVLRRARDRARERSALGSAAVALYERSSPPLADLLRGTDEGRALVRQAIAPVVETLGTLEALLGPGP